MYHHNRKIGIEKKKSPFERIISIERRRNEWFAILNLEPLAPNAGGSTMYGERDKSKDTVPYPKGTVSNTTALRVENQIYGILVRINLNITLCVCVCVCVREREREMPVDAKLK